MEIRLVSSLEKAGIGKEPEALEKAYLYALQGETVSFQIMFRDGSKGQESPDQKDGQGTAASWESMGKNGRTRIVTTVSGYGDTSGAAEAVDVRIRQVLWVMCRRSCNPDSKDEDYLFYDARMAPDLLRDIDPEEGITVTGEWQSLWVDICPREGCEAGSYHIGFDFRPQPAGRESGSADDCMNRFGSADAMTDSRGLADAVKDSAKIGIDMQVIGKLLPEMPIPHTEWFHCDGIADYYKVEVFSEEFWRIFRNFLSTYVKRGGNTILTPILTPPLDTEVGGERTTVQLVDVERLEGQYKLGFEKLERFLDICLETGIRYFEICHLFTQWGAVAAPKVVALVDGRQERIFGWDTPSDDPEYLGFLTVLLPALKELMERRGLLQNTFFHISDEPNMDSEHYDVSQGTVRRLLKGCTIIEAVSDYTYYEKGLVDIPVCAVNYIEPFLEKRPPRLWTYYCCAQTQEVPNRFISMPSWRNRIYGTLLYWHGIDGILHWGYNFYNSAFSKKKIDPYETVDADGMFPAGDPFLVYPGKDGIPEESIRLMVFEEALNDYRALRLLEARIGREQVMELIRREAGMELSFTRYPRSAEFILRLREKVNRMLATAV